MIPIHPILKTLFRYVGFSALFLIACVIYIFLTGMLLATFGTYAIVGMVAFLICSFIWIFKMK